MIKWIVFFYLCIHVVSAATIDFDVSELSEGQSFVGRINLTQEEIANIGDLKKLEGKYLLNKLYVSEIVQNNTNNGQINFLGVALQPVQSGESALLKFGDGQITFSVNDIDFKKNDLKPQKEIILYELSDGIIKRINKILLFIIVLVLLVLGFYGFKYYEKQKLQQQIKKLREEEIKFWKDQFSQANERVDFEHIYAKRKLWANVLGMEIDLSKSFLTKVNNIQYKEDWSEFEKDELAREFNKLKEEVNKIDGI